MTTPDGPGREGLPKAGTDAAPKPNCVALAASLAEQCAAVEQLTARLTRGAADMCDSTADVLAFVLHLGSTNTLIPVPAELKQKVAPTGDLAAQFSADIDELALKMQQLKRLGTDFADSLKSA